MDLPSSENHIDLGSSEEELHARVKDVCIELVPGWRQLSKSSLVVSKISGGITNILMLVAPAEEREDMPPVTVRVFGPNTDVVIDRKREWEALKVLSAEGFGARLIGSFANGVIASFIRARTLEPPDMGRSDLAPLIAREVRRFHSAQVPGSKEPQLWPTITLFLRLAQELEFDDPAKAEQYKAVDFAELSAEVAHLQAATETLNAPVVFAHNDLLSGNIMHDETTGTLYLIDFEYGTYSFRGFDLGNHFNEYAGFSCDYTLYPSREAQEIFFREYLHPGQPEKATDGELEALFVETNVYALASHLYWAIWGIVQAKHSPIDFDYLGYFFLRYNEFKNRKDEFLGLLAKNSGRASDAAS